MKTAGVRQLRDKLSEFLRDVRRGEVVLVTDHGRVVAELRPPGTGADLGLGREERERHALLERGVISTLGSQNGEWPPPAKAMTPEEFEAHWASERER
jgi:antitoxin (DNA-binding transcriptional repressor) of toxin-antitoxin stability system